MSIRAYYNGVAGKKEELFAKFFGFYVNYFQLPQRQPQQSQ